MASATDLQEQEEQEKERERQEIENRGGDKEQKEGVEAVEDREHLERVTRRKTSEVRCHKQNNSRTPPLVRTEIRKSGSMCGPVFEQHISSDSF